MTTETSSIDDLLMGGKTNTQPETPEYEAQNEMASEESFDYDAGGDDNARDIQNDTHEDSEIIQENQTETDDYGNEKEAPRTYTEDEVSERINKAVRERLMRMKSQDQSLPSVQQVQQAQDGFTHNPNGEGDWQQQLDAYIEQTFNKINQRQQTQAQQRREQEARSEFEDKFTTGMERFNDFRDVVSAQPITDAMTLALRGMKDPAAFVYAASKRHSSELQRISNIRDPYAQMVEMGKLEERMRKSSTGTKAPRPVGRTMEDTGMPEAKKTRDDSIENLIAQADAKRRAQMTLKRGR